MGGKEACRRQEKRWAQNFGPRTLDPNLSLSLQGQKKSETKKGENLPPQGAKNFRKEHCREGGNGFFFL